ncbi:GNAT family N-acetyltransferase [Gorillibacterium timonense]|uniref:GNAT family N-acetyltransferase n=1 Tax=Gorillibacterium timonense TaxID=1689269 RepID=UPI00071D05DD|nr:GNAT family N-acetyltransferase [Gorillibacterium timonense]
MVTLREAVREDVPELLRIYNHYVQTSTATFDLEPQSLEQRLEWFSHYGGSYPLLVAESDGCLAGYAYLSVFRAKPAYRPTVESSVYLDKAFHNRGIGTMLMKELLRRSKTLGYHSVIACITVGNDTSVHMHERFGYRLVGTFPQTGWKFNGWHDVQFYQLMLEEWQMES